MSAPSSMIERDLAQRFLDVGRVHLVRAAVAERRRRVGGLAERPVERRAVLRRVRHDRDLREARVVERLADARRRGRPSCPRARRCRRRPRRARARRARAARRSRRWRPRRRRACRSGRATVYSHRHTSVTTSRSGTSCLMRADRRLHRRVGVPGRRADRRPCCPAGRTAARRGTPSALAAAASLTASSTDS